MVEKNLETNSGIVKKFSFSKMARTGALAIALALNGCVPITKTNESAHQGLPLTTNALKTPLDFHTYLNSSFTACSTTHNQEESIAYNVIDNRSNKVIAVEMATFCVPTESIKVALWWGSNPAKPEGADMIDRNVSTGDTLDVSIVQQGGNRWNVIIEDNNAGFTYQKMITMSQFNPGPQDGHTCNFNFSSDQQSLNNCPSEFKN